MTFLSSLAARSVRAPIEDPARPLTDPTLITLFESGKVAAGVTVTPEKSLGVMAVWRAVNLIAGTCASLPLHAYEQDGDARKRRATGPAATLLATPHPDLTSFELWETVYAHVALWGNAYLWKLRDQSGQIRELWPIHPARVKVGRTSDGGKKFFEVDGEPETEKNILHIPGFGFDGTLGMSPVTAARQGLGLSLAAEEFGARFFANGTLATGILRTEQKLTPGKADELQERWQAKRSGLNSSHSTIVLDSGADFTQLTIPPDDAQFLETRKFQVAEVARMFGVPPHMLMDTDRSTSWGTGIEQQGIGFVVYTLRPWLARVEQRLSRMVRPESVYVRYSVEGLLRGDSTQRQAFYHGMWNLGAFSTNEIRALEELPPVEGGDVRYRPLNMGLLGETDSTLTPQEASQNA